MCAYFKLNPMKHFGLYHSFYIVAAVNIVVTDVFFLPFCSVQFSYLFLFYFGGIKN